MDYSLLLEIQHMRDLGVGVVFPPAGVCTEARRLDENS